MIERNRQSLSFRHASTLASDAERELEQIVGQFEDAWAVGQPHIEHYLDRASLVARDELLVELVHVDAHRRLISGEQVHLEDYLNRFPILADLPVAMQELADMLHVAVPAPHIGPAAATVGGNAPHDTARPGSSETISSDTPELPQLPGFEFVRVLGRGGMGTVYEAWQPSLHRHVAIKMVQAEQRSAAMLAARLKNEARSVAALHHPHIVAVFEVGEHAAQPYLVMEHLPGGTLEERIAQGALAPGAAAELARQLATAMQQAHAARLVHRDLKPANVLFTSDGSPKISDFGLARNLTDDVGLTRTGEILGTPCYMAPEQVTTNASVGPSADIYSLGGVLYTALTGQRPFTAVSIHEVLLQVAREAPVAPRDIDARIPRDLETICLKCLEKEPDRRYASMELLADDLQRFLSGETVLARRAGPMLRLQRWARRNRAIATMLMLMIALLAGVAVFATAAAVRIDRARDLADQRAQAEAAARAEAERLRAQSEAERVILAQREEELSKNAYASAIQLAHVGIDQGHTASTASFLQDAQRFAETLGPLPFELRYLQARYAGAPTYETGQSDRVLSLQFTPDQRFLVGGSVDGVLHVWEAQSHQVVRRIQAHDKCINTLAFSADGDLLVTTSCDNTVKFWNTHDWSCQRTLHEHPVEVDGCAISDCGEILATATFDLKHKVPAQYRLWKISTGELVRKWDGTSVGIKNLYFADEDGTLISGGYDGLMERWDLTQDPPQAAPLLPAHAPRLRPEFNGLWRSPDRNTYACVGISASRLCVVLYDATTDDIRIVQVEPERCEIALSPDGRWIATAGRGDKTQLFDLRQGRILLSERSYGQLESIVFTPDGEAFVSGYGSGPVRKHVVRSSTYSIPSTPHASTYDPLSNRLFVPVDEQTVAAFDIDTASEVARWHVESADNLSALSLAGPARLVLASKDRIQLLDLDSGAQLWNIDDPRITLVASSPDGAYLAWTSGRVLKLTNARTAELIWQQAISDNVGGLNDLTVLPEGRVILTGQLRVFQFDCVTGTPSMFADGAAKFRYLSPESPSESSLGPWALVLHTSSWIQGLDYSSGQRLARLFGHEQHLVDACYSPDGRTLASVDQHGTVRLWMTSTQRPLCELAKLTFQPHHCRFSADGKRLIVWQNGTAAVSVYIFRAE